MRALILLLSCVFWTSLYGGYPDYYMGSIELLYFKPTVDQSFYAINSANVVANGQHYPNGTRYKNDSSFNPGFRLEGVYGLCDQVHELDFRFAYFNEGHTDSVRGLFLFDTIGFPGDGAQTPEDTVYNGTSSYTQHFRYYGVDATFNRFSPCFCPDNFSFFLGLHFAYLKFDERASSDGTSDDTTAPIIVNRLERHSHFWGLGPEFGIDARFLLFTNCCGRCSLGTNARAALMATHTWADLHYKSARTGPIGVNLDNQHLWRILPSVDVKVFLSFDTLFRCLHLSYELGYELIWYSNAVNAITGYDVAFAGDTIDLFSSFNLQGPYIAVRVGF